MERKREDEPNNSQRHKELEEATHKQKKAFVRAYEEAFPLSLRGNRVDNIKVELALQEDRAYSPGEEVKGGVIFKTLRAMDDAEVGVKFIGNLFYTYNGDYTVPFKMERRHRVYHHEVLCSHSVAHDFITHTMENENVQVDMPFFRKGERDGRREVERIRVIALYGEIVLHRFILNLHRFLNREIIRAEIIKIDVGAFAIL